MFSPIPAFVPVDRTDNPIGKKSAPIELMAAVLFGAVLHAVWNALVGRIG